MAPKEIPDRWEPYIPIGSPVQGTRFIALKVPLKEHICAKLQPKLRWTVDILTKTYPDIGMIVDFTLTKRYYDYVDVLNKGVDYCKVAIPGQQLPSESLVKRFFAAVDFYLDRRRDDSLIGIHCTHGVNRTGYMIARYMIQRMGFSVSDALESITVARGHPIERENYISDLTRHLEKMPKVLDGSDIHRGRATGEPPRMSLGVKVVKKKKPLEPRTGKGTVKRHGPARNDNRDGNAGEWKKPRKNVNPWEPGCGPEGPGDIRGPPEERFDNPRNREFRGPNVNKIPMKVWENEKNFDDHGHFEEQNFPDSMEEMPFDRYPQDEEMERGGRDRPSRKRFPDRRGPPSNFREDRGLPPQFREERGPPPLFREEHGPELQFREERGPPPAFREERGPPHHFREDRGPSPPFREERGPPPQFRDERGPPPQFREERGPPHPFREGRGQPPPFREEHGPPPPFRDGPGPHFRGEREEKKSFNRGRSDDFNRDSDHGFGPRGSDSDKRFDGRGHHYSQDEDWEDNGPPQPEPVGDRRGFQGRRGSPQKRREDHYQQGPPPSRRMSPPDRQMSPRGRRMSPPGRRMSPPLSSVRRMSPPPGRGMSPPHGRSIGGPPGRRMSPQGGRMSPPGRRMSPHGRRMSPPHSRRMSPPHSRRMSPPHSRRMSPPHSRRMSPPPDRNMSAVPFGRISPQQRVFMPPVPQQRVFPPPQPRMSPPRQPRMSPPRQRRKSPPRERMSPPHHQRMSPPRQHRITPPPREVPHPHPMGPRGSPPRQRGPEVKRGPPPRGDIHPPFLGKPGLFERPSGEPFPRSRSPLPTFKPPVGHFDERGRQPSPGPNRMRRSRSPGKRRSPPHNMPPAKRRGSPLHGRITPPPFKKDSRQQRPGPKDMPPFESGDFGLRKDSRPPGPRGNVVPFGRVDSTHDGLHPPDSGRPRHDDRGLPDHIRHKSPPQFSNRHDGAPNQLRDQRDFEEHRLGPQHFKGPMVNQREEQLFPAKPQLFIPQRSASPIRPRGGRSPPSRMITEQYPVREDSRIRSRSPIQRPLKDKEFPPRHIEGDSYEPRVGRQPFRSPERSLSRKDRGPDSSKREQHPPSRGQSRDDRPRSSGRSKSSNIEHGNERPHLDKRRDGPPRKTEHDGRGGDFPQRPPPPIYTERPRFNDQQGGIPRDDRYRSVSPPSKYKLRETQRGASPHLSRETPLMKPPMDYSPRHKRSSSPGFPEINDKGWDAELEQDCRELILQKRITTVSRSISGLSNSSIKQRLDAVEDVIVIEDSSDPDLSRPPSRSRRRPASSRLSPKLEQRGKSRSPRSKKPVFDRLEDKKPAVFERLEDPSARRPAFKGSSPRKPRGVPRGRR